MLTKSTLQRKDCYAVQFSWHV